MNLLFSRPGGGKKSFPDISHDPFFDGATKTKGLFLKFF